MSDTSPLTLVAPALGSSSGFSANSTTAAAQTPSTSLIQSITGFSGSTGGVTKQTSTLTQTTVAPLSGQPATTPATSTDAQPLPNDYYRAGYPEQNVNFTGSPSTVLHTRVVDDDADQLASISIQVPRNAIQNSNLASSVGTGAGGAFGILINMYSRFFLQGVVEQQLEKYQIVETFTDFYVFFYGKKPSFYRFNGLLMSDEQNSWNDDMMYFYENYFRGTQTAELAAQAVIAYNRRTVYGFIVGMTMQETAEMNKGIPFSLDVLVLEHIPGAVSGDITDFVASLEAIKAQSANLTAFQQALIKNNTINTAPLQSAISAASGQSMPISQLTAPFNPATANAFSLLG